MPNTGLTAVKIKKIGKTTIRIYQRGILANGEIIEAAGKKYIALDPSIFFDYNPKGIIGKDDANYSKSY